MSLVLCLTSSSRNNDAYFDMEVVVLKRERIRCGCGGGSRDVVDMLVTS